MVNHQWLGLAEGRVVTHRKGFYHCKYCGGHSIQSLDNTFYDSRLQVMQVMSCERAFRWRNSSMPYCISCVWCQKLPTTSKVPAVWGVISPGPCQELSLATSHSKHPLPATTAAVPSFPYPPFIGAGDHLFHIISGYKMQTRLDYGRHNGGAGPGYCLLDGGPPTEAPACLPSILIEQEGGEEEGRAPCPFLV